MANEYLKRTPTSTGNRKVWTWSGWVKINSLSGTIRLFNASPVKDNITDLRIETSGAITLFDRQGSDASTEQVRWIPLLRDFGSWYHILINADTTQIDAANRVKCFVNGVSLSRDAAATLLNNSAAVDTPPRNQEFWRLNGTGYQHYIGANLDNALETVNANEFTDIFFIDGQALTPDVFGFNKVGKGYISVGSTQSTDFRPGQWVPKTPRVIKTAINNNGGFGVNGFYLPMNDSNNFGADFHCDPNSIIKLQENLPQPRCRIDGVGDYTGALRDDQFKQYLIYAQPNVLGGLQNGYGDYSHIIRGSGSPKTITGGDAGASGTPVISTTQSLYYGSSLYFDGSNDTINVETNDSNYLGRDFTIEFWIWMDSQASQLAFNTTPHTSFAISLNRGGSGQTSLFIGNGSSWQLTDFRSGGVLYSQQWNHVAVERYNNAITIYHNGVAQGSYKQGDQVVTNSGTFTGVMPTGFSSLFRYGTYNNISGEPVFGYIQDYRVYSGVAKYKGGFDVPRPYTPVGIATWRAVPDSPANNFATWNPLDRARNTGTQTDGNLSTATNTGNYAIRSTVGVSTGKWYWEFCPTAGTITNHHGIVAVGRSMGAFYLGETLDSWGMYDSNGNKRNNGSFDSYGTGFSQYDVGMVALDKSNGKIWWGKNGTWFASGNPSNATNEAFSNINIVCSGIGTDSFVSPSQLQYNSCSYNFGQNPSFSGNTTAGTYTDSNNKGLFKYQPPSGFLALCEDNLPTPAISDPGKYFKTVLYTGDGNSGRSIVGVGFTPDLVWIKSRTNTNFHNIADSVRGAGQILYSNSTSTGENNLQILSSFNGDGFGIGNDNSSNQGSQNFVAWCWRAGAGTTSTNTNGSITSVVSVNQDAGFSIVSYTGNGTIGATVGHGLNKTVKFMITKSRNTTDNWVVHTNVTGTQTFSFLNLINGGTTDSVAPPTSSVFYRGSANTINGSGLPYISYCWAEIEGFSKFGSYTGNGSTDGPFVYCGFRPAWVMIKSSSSTENWNIFDNVRKSVNDGDQRMLSANTSDIEDTGWPIDFLSNGFKNRYAGATNNSGVTYIFAAYAESPFQTANAK